MRYTNVSMEMAYLAATWHGMAEDARAVAANLRDHELRQQMLAIAAGYEVMARRCASLSRMQPANDRDVDASEAAD